MINMWVDCLIASLKSWDSVKASRRDEVKAELDRRLANGEISQDTYNAIFGIEPEVQAEVPAEDESEDE